EVDLVAVEIDRGVGRQLERVEGDGDLRGVLITGDGGQPRLEVALADVAPRAGDVGPDVYRDGFAHIIVQPHDPLALFRVVPPWTRAGCGTGSLHGCSPWTTLCPCVPHACSSPACRGRARRHSRGGSLPSSASPATSWT